MLLIRDAVNAVQRNLAALGIYVAVAVVWNIAVYGADIAMGVPESASDIGLVSGLYGLFKGIAGLAVYAALNAIVFSMFGRDIDRPLWKVADNKEALQRFFPLWFTILFIGWIIEYVAGICMRNYATESLGYMLILLFMAHAMVATPIGACVMFQGRFQWEHFPEALNPLVRQGAKTGIVLLMTLAQVGFYIYVLLNLGEDFARSGFQARDIGIISAFIAISTYIECLVFSAVWIICMVDRDTLDEVDLDF